MNSEFEASVTISHGNKKPPVIKAPTEDTCNYLPYIILLRTKYGV